jgi:ABC-type dipeptide/oligopeptide/nickel transport system permease subunit
MAKTITMKQQTDTYSYKGWLNSDNFFKRLFAVYGYCLVASLIVAIVCLGMVFIFGLLFGLLFGLAAF